MERQWSLKRERARYDAERARRQYDAVEPENRFVARSLERVWEERLRRAEQIEQEYSVWRREQAVSIAEGDRQEILALGEDLPRLWHATTTTSADRKQIIRLVIKEVTLDQKRRRGFVWIRIVWQTGSASEHWVQRTVQSYAAHADQDRLRQRIVELNGSKRWMARSPTSLTGRVPNCARPTLLRQDDPPLAEEVADHDRQDQRQGSKPARWPDGTYSVQGAAAAIGITPQIIFDWLRRVADRKATRERHALADHANARAGHRAPSQGPTHQPIQERGIMKASSHRRRSAIRRRRDWW